MDEIASASRSLPLYASLPLALLVSALLAVFFVRAKSGAARFVMFAIWLRCLLAAFHAFSFHASPIGISYNALGSLLAAGIGLLVLRKRNILDPAIIAFVPIFSIILLSGVLNAQVSSMATVLSKFAYLFVLVLVTEEAIEDLGLEAATRLLMWPFAIPVGLQILSVILHAPKPAESDGSASYIGGFWHEAAFSVTVIGALLLVCLNFRMQLGRRLFLLALFLISVMLANYRTTVLAILPMIGMSLLVAIPRRVMPRHRAIVAIFMLVAVSGVGVAGAIAEQDRFADLAVVAERGTGIIQRPGSFSYEDRHLLSGRAEIWSGYIYAWIDSNQLHRMIGFGPETWSTRFTLYAHNTLISTLYEMGYLGVIAYLFLWLWMFGLALFARVEGQAELIAAHIGFFILNMATMPMWMIEGMIFYGLLCGVTLNAYKRSRVVDRAPQVDLTSAAVAA